jgi:hypothetical protein
MKSLRRTILISLIVVCFINVLSVTSYSEEPQKHTVKPTAGYVPDEETAIKIAIAVWSPIYGKDIIDAEKPYKAILKDGVWYVSGSLPKGYVKGGVAVGEINKDDGRIIRISHGK